MASFNLCKTSMSKMTILYLFVFLIAEPLTVVSRNIHSPPDQLLSSQKIKAACVYPPKDRSHSAENDSHLCTSPTNSDNQSNFERDGCVLIRQYENEICAQNDAAKDILSKNLYGGIKDRSDLCAAISLSLSKLNGNDLKTLPKTLLSLKENNACMYLCDSSLALCNVTFIGFDLLQKFKDMHSNSNGMVNPKDIKTKKPLVLDLSIFKNNSPASANAPGTQTNKNVSAHLTNNKTSHSDDLLKSGTDTDKPIFKIEKEENVTNVQSDKGPVIAEKPKADKDNGLIPKTEDSKTTTNSVSLKTNKGDKPIAGIVGNGQNNSVTPSTDAAKLLEKANQGNVPVKDDKNDSSKSKVEDDKADKKTDTKPKSNDNKAKPDIGDKEAKPGIGNKEAKPDISDKVTKPENGKKAEKIDTGDNKTKPKPDIGTSDSVDILPQPVAPTTKEPENGDKDDKDTSLQIDDKKEQLEQPFEMTNGEDMGEEDTSADDKQDGGNLNSQLGDMTGKDENENTKTEDRGTLDGIEERNEYKATNSHFFPYFLTVAVLCVVVYLVFHNKQKILALIIEGWRVADRRRSVSRGPAYKHLH